MLKFGRRLHTNHTPAGTLVIDYDRCCSCGTCTAVCPANALFLHGLYLTADQTRCTICERCMAACPTRALSLADDEQAPR